jgi:hypothetical protein
MLREKEMQLQMRGGQLMERSRELRLRLSGEARALQRPLALADRAVRGVNLLRANHQWLLAAAAPALLLRPRRVVSWGLKLWWAWRLWRRVHAALAPSRAQPPWKPPLR